MIVFIYTNGSKMAFFAGKLMHHLGVLLPHTHGQKIASFAPFYTQNTINLPRQARDKHRENSK
jgi:hypothetical protein